MRGNPEIGRYFIFRPVQKIPHSVQDMPGIFDRRPSSVVRHYPNRPMIAAHGIQRLLVNIIVIRFNLRDVMQ